MRNGRARGKECGWARGSRHHPEPKQVADLEQAGAYPIYRASEHDIADVIRSLLPGDTVLMTTLGRIAPNRGELREALADINSKKAFVRELSTGRSTKNAAEAAVMAVDAITELTGDARALTRKQAREYGSKGGKANAKRIARERDRMSNAEAKAIWANPVFAHLSNEDVIEKMPGWTIRAAYRHLKKRGLAKGRPPVKR